MVNSSQGWGRRLGLVAWAMSGAISFGIASLHDFSGNRAFAQVIPDPTLGTEPSVVTPNVDINGIPSDRIDGGATRGANLFHSFSEFNVGDGRGVYFTNPAGIENILSRVTGRNLSNIQGTLGVLGNANLFLINSNGIIFGPNARLDLQGGSFVGTTANAILFPGRGEFSMNSPVDNNPVLALNPSALFFNQTPAGAIQYRVPNATAPNTLDGLRVPDGRSLLLVGGDVSMEGGVIQAPGGRVELGGLAAPGEVNIDVLSNGNLGLRFPDGVAQANVSLTNAKVDVGSQPGTDSPGGDISITGNQLSIVGSELASRSASSSSEFGVIRLTATQGSVLLLEGSVLSTTNTDTSGLAGDIFINAADGVSINGSRIFSNGRAGRIFIDARNHQISIVNNSRLYTESNDENTTALFSVIKLTAPEGSVLVDQSELSTTNVGSGYAGDIGISGRNEVSLNNSKISSDGNLGRIIIGEFSVADSDPDIEVSFSPERVAITNSFLTTNNKASQAGADQPIPSGVIRVDATASISLLNSQLQTFTSRRGDAGSVFLQANGGITSLDNSRIYSTVESGGVGNGGNIRVETGALSMSNASGLQTLLRGPSDDGTLLGAQGDAGVIVVLAEDSVSLSSESGIFSRINAGADGDTGNNQFAGNVFGTLLGTGGDIVGSIFISTGTLSLTDNSQLDSSTFGNGNAGAVVVLAREKVSLSNASNIFSRVEPGGVGNSGGVIMGVGSLSITDGSKITTSALGVGNPGIILVGADKDISLRGNDSGIFSQVSEGNSKADLVGGGIGLEARSLFIRDGAVVSVSNFAPSKAGDIEITAHEDIILRDKGIIAALSVSGQGGNISLTSGDSLILVSGSQVSTEAGRGMDVGNGGNVYVDTRYIIAAPFNDNNISAQAGQFGGRIGFEADRLYDIEERVNVLVSNDIDASSDFGIDGIVTGNVLNVDPTQGLANLPANPVDPTQLIAETCAPRGGIAERQRNRFIVTGRGGLPPDPNAAFPGEAVVNDLGTPGEREESTTDDPNSTNPTSPAPAATASPQEPEIAQAATASPQEPEIAPATSTSPQESEMVEAQGWVYGENGDIIFTARPSNGTVTPNNPALTPASTCNVSSTLPQ